MATIQLELFALPEELLGWLQALKEVQSSWKTLIRFRPDFSARTIPPEAPLVYPLGEGFSRICFTTERPNLAVKSAYDFLLSNPSALAVDIGAKEAGSLTASALGARTENATSADRWKEIAKHLKKMTRAGLWVRSAHTGAKSFTRSFRYSEGAHTFSVEGGLLKPVAGSALLSVEEPND